jgi:hypothetical protein
MMNNAASAPKKTGVLRIKVCEIKNDVAKMEKKAIRQLPIRISLK